MTSKAEPVNLVDEVTLRPVRGKLNYRLDVVCSAGRGHLENV